MRQPGGWALLCYQPAGLRPLQPLPAPPGEENPKDKAVGKVPVLHGSHALPRACLAQLPGHGNLHYFPWWAQHSPTHPGCRMLDLTRGFSQGQCGFVIGLFQDQKKKYAVQSTPLHATGKQTILHSKQCSLLLLSSVLSDKWRGLESTALPWLRGKLSYAVVPYHWTGIKIYHSLSWSIEKAAIKNFSKDNILPVMPPCAWQMTKALNVNN